MATRVSPRSNASSASSSSTSSTRRTYRNPSFGRHCDNPNLDPWVPDGRSAYAAKQQQQHTRGQWGQKSHQAGRGWSDSATQCATKESDSRLEWRSQKQAVDSFSGYLDRGQFQGAHQLERSYKSSSFQPQGLPTMRTSNGQWNVNPKEQSFYAQQSEPQSSWGRHQTKPNRLVPDKFARGGNITYDQGYTSGRNTHDNHGIPATILNATSEIRGTAASFQQGFRDYSITSNHGSLGHVGQSSQGSRHSTGRVSGSGGAVELQRAQGGSNGWEKPRVSNSRGLGEKIDSYRPLIIRDGTGQRNDEVASTSGSLATNRYWEGMGAVTGSWADECGDDAPQTFQVGAKSVGNTYKAERGYHDVATIRRPNDSDNSRSSFDTGVANRDKWRQNSWRGSNDKVGAGTSTHSLNSKQGSNVKQGEAGRNSGQQGSVKHSMSTALDHMGKAGTSSNERGGLQKEVCFRGSEGGQEATTPKNQMLSAQENVEVSDDATLPFIMGTCEDMCPLKEREQRERLRDLAVFERVNRNPSKTSKQLAVKKFCRTFTGVKLLSEDVRPLRILWSTLQYLLNLLDDTEFAFDVIHNFLFDRTRAIRQELGMQRIANSQAINMYEEIVRFHILSEHELNQRGSGRRLSDSHLNLQQLSKSLLSLFDLYSLNRKEKPANEAEFRAYYVLLNLDSNKHHQADLLSVWFRQCPAVLLKSWELKFTRAILRCYRLGNYRAFFQLAQEATFLQSCLMELHFNEVRLQSLSAMNQGGYKLHPIPLADIAKQLLIKEGDLEELCTLCGLSAGMDSSRVRCLFVKQSQFSAPKELPFYRCPCIINKKPASYFEEVTGTRQRL
ncbi:hypothetical protein GOP47_0002755 [Adiantum capillus-veneris]|uniref:PCI domain-containing protein n=1 Tax=Adiantum capillus-veneris TaxID=13818 RepID=A0A9D4VB87_ADICA|nr:hypothetical protein GOP47_0002755 [Adiantum capillus-veneris]